MSRNCNYIKESKGHYERLAFRLRWQKEEIEGEWYDGVHLDPTTIPDGKYLYETRHSDTCENLSLPASIKDSQIIVNFCGSLVTDKPIMFKGKKLSGEIPVAQCSVNYL